MTAPATLSVLTMCTHNRTRSVMIGALLGEHLARRGVVPRIATAGLRESDLPPTEPTVRLLAKRGLDVSDHHSSLIDDAAVAAAELIVTAERQHVVFVAGRWPGTFERTFTLPELVHRAAAVGPRSGGSLAAWLARVNEGRTIGQAYLLSTDVAEVADPTGQSPGTWRAAIEEIDDLCARLARVLA